MKAKLFFILLSFIHHSQSQFFSDLIGYSTQNRDVELLGNGFPLSGGNRRNGVVRSGRQEVGEEEIDFLFPDDELDPALIQEIFTTPAVTIEELLPVTEKSQTENEDDDRLETAVDPVPIPTTESSSPTTNPQTTTILPDTTIIPETTTIIPTTTSEVPTTATEVPTSTIPSPTDTPIPTTIEVATTTTTPLILSDPITTTIQQPTTTAQPITVVRTLSTTETSFQPTTTQPTLSQDGPRISNSRPSQDPQNSISGTDEDRESVPRIVNRPPVNSSTMSIQPPTVNSQSPTVNNQPPTVNNQPPTVNSQPPTVNSQPPAVNNLPPTNILSSNNGPRRMKFCLPLSRPDCGLLADPSLTSGVLQFIEDGNIKASSLNEYLTNQLLSSVQRIPGRSELISLFPNDVSFKRSSLPSRNLVGSYQQCENKVKLHHGGYIEGQIRPDTTDILESGGSLFKTTPVFYQGVVGWDANLSGKLHATFYKNILITCLKKGEKTQRASTRIGGSAAVGAVMNAKDFQLDYVDNNRAELSFIFDLGLKAQLLGVDSGSVNIQGCRFSSGLSQVSACGQLGDLISAQLRSMAQNPFFVQGSTPLFNELENIVGAKKGERVVLVLQRNPVNPPAAPSVPQLDISGLGRTLPSSRSPRRLSLLHRLQSAA